MNKLSLALMAALAAVPATALADGAQAVRCTTVDNLDIPTAMNRIEWARKCGLLVNSGTPSNFFLSNKAFDSSSTNFLGAKDYKEGSTAAAWSNNLNEYDVNLTRAFSLFGQYALYLVTQDASGPTLNYYNWNMTSTETPRPQPYYPSFDINISGTGGALFPPANANINSPCTFFTDKAGTVPYAGTAHTVAFYCAAGCYTDDQQVLFDKGNENILDAYTSVRSNVVTLAPNATIDDPRQQVSPVGMYTRDARDGNQVIYVVTTASGGEVKVTNSHPVMISDGTSGKLVMAEKLRVGDEMVKADGTPDAVVSVEKQNYFGRAYNLQPVSTDHIQNILIAQGYLMGSLRYQNDDLNYMNRALLFRAIPDDVIPR